MGPCPRTRTTIKQDPAPQRADPAAASDPRDLRGQGRLSGRAFWGSCAPTGGRAQLEGEETNHEGSMTTAPRGELAPDPAVSRTCPVPNGSSSAVATLPKRRLSGRGAKGHTRGAKPSTGRVFDGTHA